MRPMSNLLIAIFPQTQNKSVSIQVMWPLHQTELLNCRRKADTLPAGCAEDVGTYTVHEKVFLGKWFNFDEEVEDT